MKVKSESEVAQSCLTLSDPMDYSLLAPLHPESAPLMRNGDSLSVFKYFAPSPSILAEAGDN